MNLRLSWLLSEHEYSFPKFGSALSCFILWVSQLLSYYECVSRFDLARLSLRLGPTLPYPCPVHPPPSHVPGRYPWPKSFMHIAPCQFQNMNGIITHALHISPILLHNMYEWVTVHSSKYALFQSMLQQKQIRVYTLENHVTASHRIIVRQRHGHCKSRHRQLHKGQCGTNLNQGTHGHHTAQYKHKHI